MDRTSQMRFNGSVFLSFHNNKLYAIDHLGNMLSSQSDGMGFRCGAQVCVVKIILTIIRMSVLIFVIKCD